VLQQVVFTVKKNSGSGAPNLHFAFAHLYTLLAHSEVSKYEVSHVAGALQYLQLFGIQQLIEESAQLELKKSVQ